MDDQLSKQLEEIKANPEPQKVEEAKPAAESEKKIPDMQMVYITLADGRKGAFMGPELVSASEMKEGSAPQLVAVDFSLPKPFKKPETITESIPQEVAPDAGSTVEKSA